VKQVFSMIGACTCSRGRSGPILCSVWEVAVARSGLVRLSGVAATGRATGSAPQHHHHDCRPVAVMVRGGMPALIAAVAAGGDVRAAFAALCL
jgi:hypothetical protein